MRIGVNTRFLLKNKMEGFGWFTYETVKRIVKAHPEHEFIFFFDRPFAPKFVFADNVTPVVLQPPTRLPILLRLWFNVALPRAFKKHRVDLFFSPDGFLSLNTQVPQINVMHDLNFEHYPEDLPAKYKRYYKKYFPQFAQKAAHILTVSHYSKADISQRYQISPERITVAHNGASDAFKPLPIPEQHAFRDENSQGLPYFVFVGALHARKNVGRLFHAFDQFKEATGSPTQLMIVGEKLFRDASLDLVYQNMKHQNAVIFTGHLGLDELTQALGSARALVFPSYFEGFGIPLVEAMKAHCPIVSSNKTALPEVAGEAALYFDPFSIEEMANALARIDGEAGLREQLIHAGAEQAKKFNWDFTAATIWEVLERELHR